jgi:hypothetical protein
MINGVVAIGIPHHDHEVVVRLVVLIPSRHSVRVGAAILRNIPRQRFGIPIRVDGDVMVVPVADLHFCDQGRSGQHRSLSVEGGLRRGASA